jgi:hypothetical protein
VRATGSSSVAALRTALAVAHAGYQRALEEAQRATDPADRRAALAEARRLAGRAAQIQSQLRDR